MSTSAPDAMARTPKIRKPTTRLPTRIAHGAQRGRWPFVRRTGPGISTGGSVLGGAVVTVMSVGSREVLAPADDPAGDRIDGERDDEEEEAGGDQGGDGRS